MSLAYKFRGILLPRMELFKGVGIKEGFQVLDFGCRPGSYILPFSRLVGKWGRAHVMDRNPLAIEAVNSLVFRKQLTNVNTIASDCRTRLVSGSMDVVLLYCMIHHLKARYNVLVELHPVLKGLGVL